MKKFNHAMDLGFEVASDLEEPTSEEIREGLLRRLRLLEEEEADKEKRRRAGQRVRDDETGFGGSCQVFDTCEFETEEFYQRWLKEE